MSDNRENRDHRIQDPHFDGIREGIINDSEGKRMGVRADTKKDPKNPYNVDLKEDPEMKKLE
ncbi:hypothetical protein GMD78_06225 [Ornithinibacillus sp. L9]|uniref:Uncharacterized protein n=1 Tax=Ornithinibacillus caprae TaxID=2678566 RepID=A0A6N8FIA9_9BACI|nr:hypothetical protein [Ornithinibacillus caprae]MUK87994.1 hypothetical protein [Ornithinibacillus caprae]